LELKLSVCVGPGKAGEVGKPHDGEAVQDDMAELFMKWLTTTRAGMRFAGVRADTWHQ
jgi:hypothetical protein